MKNLKRNVAIVCGGDSSEHDVSLRSAQGLYSFFDKERYNVYIVDIKGQDWHVELHDGTTVRINTNRLPAGAYELRGRAGGSEESGLLWRESDSSIRLIITDDIPPMPAAAFTTPAGLQRIEDEAFAGIAAKVVRIHSNVEFIGDSAFAGSQTETVIIENAYTDINFNAFVECGDLVVYGIPGGDVEQWAQRNMYTFYPIPMQ